MRLVHRQHRQHGHPSACLWRYDALYYVVAGLALFPAWLPISISGFVIKKKNIPLLITPVLLSNAGWFDIGKPDTVSYALK